ncbi:hypothetical protein NKG94_17330 [Micromonospora sp. M12]
MALIGWVAVVLAAWTWATFLVALAAETVAQLRGRRYGASRATPPGFPACDSSSVPRPR